MSLDTTYNKAYFEDILEQENASMKGCCYGCVLGLLFSLFTILPTAIIITTYITK
jgi:hypothetical protein